MSDVTLGNPITAGPVTETTQTLNISGDPGLIIGAPVVVVAGPPGEAPDLSALRTSVNALQPRVAALENWRNEVDGPEAPDLSLLFDNKLS